MNKNEFISNLKKRLEVLEDSEIEDIVEEYSEHIDEKVKNGKTEEEAIKDFGDFDELVKDILSAYKVKTKKEDYNINNIFDKFVKFITEFVNYVSKLSFQEIFRLIIEIFVIVLLIWMFKIPFTMLEDMGDNLLYNHVFNPLGVILSSVWSFLIDVFYFIIAIIAFVTIIKNRYLANVDFSNVKEMNFFSKNDNKKVEEVKVERVQPKKDNTFIGFVSSICILFVKFIVILMLFPIVMTLVGICIALGFLMTLVIKGIFYLGPILTFIALIMIVGTIIDVLTKFLTNKGINTKVMLVTTIIAFILLGIGSTLFGYDVLNSTYVNEIPKGFKQTTMTKKVEMKDSLVIENYGAYTDYIIDNDLEDTVIIELSYCDKYIKPEINIINNNIVEFDLDMYRFSGNELIKSFTNSLKNKTFYNYSLIFDAQIKIYVSEENYKKIVKNDDYYDYYYHHDYYDDDMTSDFDI